MKIYLDLVFLLNYIYDFLLLITVDITLKRHMKLKRHLLSAFVGSISLIILFLPFNNVILFILKIITSILMILISFGYRNIKYFLTNTLYLYMCSIILGGFLYLLDNEFSYKRDGLVFFYQGLNPNYILLIVIAPLILWLYVKEHQKYQSIIKYNYQIRITFNNSKTLICHGFIDTGNRLRDPITKKYIILISKKILKQYINIRSPIYVPFHSLNNTGIVECFPIKYVCINKQILTNYLVGISNNNIECLLNYKIMEDLCLEK